MRKSRLSEEQITLALRQAESSSCGVALTASHDVAYGIRALRCEFIGGYHVGSSSSRALNTKSAAGQLTRSNYSAIT